jgi:hypothetical protein
LYSTRLTRVLNWPTRAKKTQFTQERTRQINYYFQPDYAHVNKVSKK